MVLLFDILAVPVVMIFWLWTVYMSRLPFVPLVMCVFLLFCEFVFALVPSGQYFCLVAILLYVCLGSFDFCLCCPAFICVWL